MYIIDITYIKPESEVDKALTAHRDYLEKYYKLGVFISWGRKVPRTGGIVLVKETDSIEKIAKEDPFYQLGLSKFEITEWTPMKELKLLHINIKR